jgi:hypothetical protein
LKLLKRAVGLEYGVQVPDQEDVGAGTETLSNQMAGALPRRSVEPPHVEAEFLKLAAEDRSDPTYPGDIHGAAVDLDGLLQ